MPLSVPSSLSDSARIPAAGTRRASALPDPQGQTVRAQASQTTSTVEARAIEAAQTQTGDTARGALPGRRPATLVYTYERRPDGGYQIVETGVTLNTIDDGSVRTPPADAEEILATIAAAHSASLPMPANPADVAGHEAGIASSAALDLVPAPQAPAASKALRAYVSAAEYFQAPSARIHITA